MRGSQTSFELPTNPPRAVWLTGLPGAGKTTIAVALVVALQARGLDAEVLDGDVLRAGAHADLDLSADGRRAHALRTAQRAVTVLQRGGWPVVALVSPMRADRAAAAALLSAFSGMLEVHVTTPAAVCAARDPKGLWAQAANGRLTGLTGYDAPYEEPVSELVVRSAGEGDVTVAVAALMAVLFATK